jgi:hypothetical protein
MCGGITNDQFMSSPVEASRSMAMDVGFDLPEGVAVVSVEKVSIPGEDHEHYVAIVTDNVVRTEEERQNIRDAIEVGERLLGPTPQGPEADRLLDLLLNDGPQSTVLVHCEVHGTIPMSTFRTTEEARTSVDGVQDQVERMRQEELAAVTAPIEEITPSFN